MTMPYGEPRPPGAFPSVNGTLILVLGILSIVLCNILGPIAWVMGNNAIAAIDRGQGDPIERPNAGRICGIIGTILLIPGVLGIILWLGRHAWRNSGVVDVTRSL